MKRHNVNKKILYRGSSLETFLRIKNLLEEKNIPYDVMNKSNDSWIRFFLMILFRATALYGTNGEHERMYFIYVSNEDYDALQPIGSEIQFSDE